MECYGQAPGFYGKLPSHGDFVGRRLPPDVRDCFDRWLQAALVRSKEELGAAWLPTWGSSPLWRFVVGAGVCGEQAWAGVMMPSADRVGRCFPLLLAAPLTGTPSLRACVTLHENWFARLEEQALSALEPGLSIDAFDAAVAAFGPAPFVCVSSAKPSPLQAPGPAQARVSELAQATEGTAALADAFIESRSAWWSHGSALVAPALAVCRGLPSPQNFVALLDGRWPARGWVAAEAHVGGRAP